MPLVVQFFLEHSVHCLMWSRIAVKYWITMECVWKTKLVSLSSPDWMESLRPTLDRKAPSDWLIGPSDSTAIGWNMWYRLNFCVFHLLPNSCTEWRCCKSCKYAAGGIYIEFASGYTSTSHQVIYWGGVCLVPRVETKLTTTGRAKTSAHISNFWRRS